MFLWKGKPKRIAAVFLIWTILLSSVGFTTITAGPIEKEEMSVNGQNFMSVKFPSKYNIAKKIERNVSEFSARVVEIKEIELNLNKNTQNNEIVICDSSAITNEAKKYIGNDSAVFFVIGLNVQ